MFTSSRLTYRLLSFIILLSITLSGFQPFAVSAQGPDGVKRQINAASSRVSFIGPESGGVLSASRALGTFFRPQDPALALAKRFGSEFGLSNPERELSEIKAKHADDGRVTVRYQQNHQGIPVLGGELIVNTNENGDLYSMNGEVSPNLSLQTQPEVASEQARDSALQALAKWYQKTPADFVASEPELWIYDESLLRPSTRPVELVWRMEVTAVDNSMPVRELVLVNAQKGEISLHFNQIDNAWAGADPSKSVQAPNVPAFSPTSPEKNDNTGVDHFAAENIPALAPVTWYVATTGLDSNSCTGTGSPCLTVNGAIGKPAVASGDIIKVATGTYTGSGTEVVLINKSVTRSGGWNAAFTTQSGTSTIEGQGVRRGITVNSSVTVSIEYFTIQNGNVTGNGGGVHNSGSLIINNSVISNTTAGSGTGSAIYNTGSGILALNNDIVTNNGSYANCFVVANEGVFTASNSVVERNTTNQGIYCATLIVMNFSGTMTLTNTTVRNNTGGGIYNYAMLTLNNSLVSGNIGLGSDGPGGIYNWGGTLSMSNSTVSGNYGGGGGLYIGGAGTATVNNSTITGNTASGSGGIYVNGAGNTVTFKNSILARNIASSAPDCYGTIGSSGYNIIGNNLGCTFSATTGDQVGTNANPINPLLGPLQNNGGSTFTHAILTGSPAINAGNPAVPGSGGNACLATDQRGVTRPVSTVCDIGAFEGSSSAISFPFLLTYTATNTANLPGTLLCTQSAFPCTGTNSHADAAHLHAFGTYNFLFTNHDRNSIDNNGMVIKSTVQYCDPDFPCPYDNAFWDGTQMVYGSAYGFPLADDVVAHELTHGVTQYEANLFSYYQSGAIDESLADMFGEYYDQVGNVTAGDTAGVKWLIGEDVSGLDAVRSMSNPPTYLDPDKMSSPYYYEGAEDSGGVHFNSGVNNKAVYLMVDGGAFNTITVTGIGWEKTAAIYYEVNTNLLTSGSDYSDLYYALQQACTNLTGQYGIIPGNCVEVKDAIDAAEMYAQPAFNFNTDAPVCEAGQPVTTHFYDDLESGTSNWTFNNGFFTRWQYDSPYGPFAHSGSHFLYADDYPGAITDATARLAAVVIPANAYLHFAHAYDFEKYIDDPAYYDGGVIEYSINGGVNWVDAGSLIDYNGYIGAVDPNYGNPLANRSAFVGSSHGYISTRLNLASLAGQSVSFRWRMGLDDSGVAWGWWLDNIRLYHCGPATSFADAPNTYWAWQYIESLYNAGITSGCSVSPRNYCPTTVVTRDQMAVFLLRGKYGDTYVPPAASGVFQDVPSNYWAAAWIEQLAADGITSGCSAIPKLYCPGTPVTRDQMAVFLLRAKYGNAYVPPAASGVFQDVPSNYWAAAWIEQLAAEGITSGCSAIPKLYCPGTPVTRDQMAVFLVHTFNLP